MIRRGFLSLDHENIAENIPEFYSSVGWTLDIWYDLNTDTIGFTPWYYYNLEPYCYLGTPCRPIYLVDSETAPILDLSLTIYPPDYWYNLNNPIITWNIPTCASGDFLCLGGYNGSLSWYFSDNDLLTSWFAFGVCPYDIDFFNLNLAKIFWDSLYNSFLQDTFIDFNIFSPINCMIWGYTDWQESFGYTWWNTSWVFSVSLLERSNSYFLVDTSSKNFSIVILNLILISPLLWFLFYVIKK